jgi:hypothetical protein
MPTLALPLRPAGRLPSALVRGISVRLGIAFFSSAVPSGGRTRRCLRRGLMSPTILLAYVRIIPF